MRDSASLSPCRAGDVAAFPPGALHSPSRHMTTLRLTSFATISALALAAACGPNKEHVRADSAAAALSTQQEQLANQLKAQKDSLTRVVLQADDFIMKVDASMN